MKNRQLDRNGYCIRTMSSKYLSVAALTGLTAICSANSAQATELKVPIPTLDNSAYNITSGIESDFDFAYPTIDSDGQYVDNYYNIELEDLETYSEYAGDITLDKTDFGSGSEVKYFGWADDINGNYVFEETTSANKDVTVKYNTGTGNYINQDQTTSAETLGGAISNTSATLGGITADFAGNYASGTSSSGGAIYNGTGSIGNIVGDFVNNYAHGSSAQGLGGAIYNDDGTFKDITGDFVGNYANGSSSQGGAIYNNAGTFGNLNSNFVGNYSAGNGAHGDGGAIFNKAGVIGDITGSFIGNYVQGSSSQGGAIYNESQIGKITGDFIGNYVYGLVAHGEAGAIYNVSGKIGDIEGDFIGNYVEGTSAQGGAISNIAEIGNIKGNFIGNYANGLTAHGEGGAIFNYATGKIGDITGDFVRNYAKSNGAAILNMGEIGDIKGDFVDNYSDGWGANGAAILNRGGSIGDLEGDFVRNYVTGDQSKGGAISNLAGSLGNITGNFIENTAFGWDAKGGAIYNAAGTIGNITGHFVENETNVAGGAIANGGTIGDIKGDFLYNISNTTGGAIGNEGSIGNITGDFIGNESQTGGAIANDGTIKDIKGHFISNQGSDGGAIGNDGEIGDITGDFVDNYASNRAGAIGNTNIIGNINGNFVGNYASSDGGAIANTGTIEDINGNFSGNTASNGKGGAIGNDGTIGDITGDFVANNGYDGGAIANDGEIGDIEGDFINNHASNSAGAIGNTNIIGNITGDFISNSANNAVGAIVNDGKIKNIKGNFIDNRAENGTAGAIANSGIIENIEGNFVENSAQTGGALVNIGEITSIQGDFQSNEAMMGAGVVNANKIGSITGNFVDNTGYIASSIYNLGNVGAIAGDFINNTSYAVNLYNMGKINSLSGNFIGNTSSNFGSGAIANDNYLGTLNSNFDSNTGSIMGGALQNSGTIGSITGDFSNNLVKGNFDEFMAPLILKMSKEELDNFDPDAWYQAQLQNVDPSNYQAKYELDSTYTSFKISKSMRPSFGGAVFNSTMNLALLGLFGAEGLNGLPSNIVQDFEIDVNNIKIGDINGNFSDNVAEGNVSYGGAIANVDWANKLNLLYQASKLMIEYADENNTGETEAEIKDYIRDIATEKQNITIGNIQGDFTNNKAASGGAIANFKMDKEVIGSLASVIDMVKVPADEDPEMIQMLSYLPDMIAKELDIDPNAVRPADIVIGNVSGNFVGNQASATNFDDFQEAIDTIYTAAESYKHMFMGSDDESITWDDVIGLINQEILQEKSKQTPDEEKIRNLERDKYFAQNVKNIDKLEASLKDSLGKGGAIFNRGGKIGDITNSTFVGNSASTDFAGINAQGGAIYNRGIIGTISADFIENHVNAVAGEAYGGAIYSEMTPLTVYNGGVICEYMQLNILNDDGSIYKQYFVVINPKFDKDNPSPDVLPILPEEQVETMIVEGKISGFKLAQTQTTTKQEFEEMLEQNNFSEEEYFEMINAEGAVLTNPKDILAENQKPVEVPALNIIDSSFVGNYVQVQNGEAKGGAIYLSGNVQPAEDNGLAAMYRPFRIENPDGSVYKEYFIVFDPTSESYEFLSTEELEALIEDGTITSFEQFGAKAEVQSKAEWDATLEQFGVTEEEFFAEMEVALGLPFVQANIKEMLANATEQSSTLVRNLILKNSNLIGNYAQAKNGEAKGGAIYAENTIVDIIADNGETTLISGNYTKNGDEIDNNAIYMDGGKLTFDIKNSSAIRIDDNINGENGYETYVTGDNTGAIIFNNDIKNTSINLSNATVNVTKGGFLGNNNSLTLNSGTLNINNLGSVPVHFNDFSLVGGQLNIDVVDVDLANETMGRITADTYSNVSSDVDINVGAMNLLSDATKDRTEILFADNEIKDNVNSGVSYLPIDSVQTAFTPIYKYNVAYDNREDGGFFVFNRASSGGSDAFNPAVLAGPIAAYAGAVSVTTQTLNYAFQHSNEFMHIPYSERLSMKNRNKYTLATDNVPSVGRFSPLYQPGDDGSSVWVKPYATFENIPFKNGPKVSNITYGTLVGFDSEMQHIKNGWDRIFTGYLGYHGASQRFSGVDSIQNGGLLGGTMTLYKGNFFNATTVSVGASVANNQTMYGNEDFAMLLSGIGNKTGYNFEFKEGKVILQPSMLMSYTFVNTFDYTNAAGVRIDSKPLHALQLMPGVKIIGNLKNGWQPYLSVSMVWNVMGESDATANGVKLPELSIKPYVRYGIGVQKRIKDHFMGYGQAMIHNGGRNGISLTAGFRWAIGHDNCKYEKTQSHSDENQNLTMKQVQNDRGKYIDNKTSSLDVGGVMPRAAEHKKIIKQMTPEQKFVHGGVRQNTSRTVNSGVLKQL